MQKELQRGVGFEIEMGFSRVVRTRREVQCFI